MRFLSPARHPDIASVRAAWEGFVDANAAPPESIRPYVRQAWERSRDAGCNPRMARAHLLSPEATADLLREHEPLLAVAHPFLAALSRAAGADRHAAMLADADGRLLEVIGDELTLADEGFPRPGSLLAESHAGANGVGTALAARGYVELVGPEHYIEGFHAFTCQGVPLHGPADIAGVLSMSVRRLETADRVRDILFCASEAAECEMLSRWLTEAVSEGKEPLLERLRQDMVQRITMARLQLEIAARQIAVGSDAATTVRAARELSRSFARQAMIWRDLASRPADIPELETIDLADLVENFIELMQTEARLAAVKLVWGRADRVRVLEDRIALSKRVLGCFLTAIQTARPGVLLEISVLAGAPGCLVICQVPAEGERGPSFTLHVPASAPRVRR